MIGQTLGHYRILEKLGAGGMGEVYLAEDTELSRRVALKVLPQEMARNPERLERFRREAQTLASLNHPNIVTVYSVEAVDEVHFLTMELLEGKTLSDYIPKRGAPLKGFFQIAIPLTDALSTAHDQGVIHRDLKPSNVMLTKSGAVKVLDFGLAKLVPTSAVPIDTSALTEPLTGEGRILGTVPYMSPEQLKGDTIDHRSDIFSVGIILYQLATGDRPFTGSTSAEVISSILRDKPTAVDDLKREMPHHIGRIVGACLEKNPERRFQSIKDVRNALEDLQRETSSQVEVSTVQAPGPKVLRARKSWAFAATAALLLVAVTAGLLIRMGSRRAPPMIDVLAVMPFANMTGDPNQTYLAEGLSAGLIHQLSEVTGLSVVGRSETWSHRGKDLSASQLGKRLGVEGVLQGVLQRGEGGLRANISLTDTRTALVLWSESFVGDREQLFALQKMIARSVTRFLSIPLSLKERRRLARNPTESVKAFDYYLQGQQFLEAVGNPRGVEFARDLFRQAIRVDPQFALAHVGLSESLWKIHKRDRESVALEGAERAAESALNLDPELPAAQVALARVYRTTSRFAESIAELRQILASHPRPEEAYRELAFSYEASGDLEAAEECLRFAVAVRSDHWHLWNSLAAFLVRLGDYPRARDAFERAAALVPDGITWPLENLATVLILEGDFVGAIEAFEQIDGAPDSAKLARNIGTAYFFTGRLEEAEKYYRLAIELDPKSPIEHGNLADLFLRQGRHDEARMEYRTALHLVEEILLSNPKDNDLRLNQALYAAKAGECETASRLVLTLKTQLPRSATYAHDRALVHALCDDPTAALEALREAIELGISPALIRQEDELQTLHKDPEFVALVGEVH